MQPLWPEQPITRLGSVSCYIRITIKFPAACCRESAGSPRDVLSEVGCGSRRPRRAHKKPRPGLHNIVRQLGPCSSFEWLRWRAAARRLPAHDCAATPSRALHHWRHSIISRAQCIPPEFVSCASCSYPPPSNHPNILRNGFNCAVPAGCPPGCLFCCCQELRLPHHRLPGLLRYRYQ